MMKLLTTLPSLGCMRGPNVLKIRATRISTLLCIGLNDLQELELFQSADKEKGGACTLLWDLYAYIIVSATRFPLAVGSLCQILSTKEMRIIPM